MQNDWLIVNTDVKRGQWQKLFFNKLSLKEFKPTTQAQLANDEH
jgi:hypothetical protein